MSESQECSKVKNFKAEIENELSHLKQNNSTIEEKKIISCVKGKMKIIFDEIEFLKQQAIHILNSGVIQNDLIKSECRVVKVQNKVYHQYEKQNGKRFLTILSPNEWGQSCPFKYLGSFKFGYDNMWTPYEPGENELSSDLEESIEKIKRLF